MTQNCAATKLENLNILDDIDCDVVCDFFRAEQDRLCRNFSSLEAGVDFSTVTWSRHDQGQRNEEQPPTVNKQAATTKNSGNTSESANFIGNLSSGGGITRILKAPTGGVFEQAGINYSSVVGVMPSDLAQKLTGVNAAQDFFATGVSMVIHPWSPMVPTMHANVRYLRVGNQQWFGGGADLTPYYLFPEDAVHFHAVMRQICDTVDTRYYPVLKKECDNYFYLPHRKEHRGVGGIFFDYIGRPQRADGVHEYQLPQGLGSIQEGQDLAFKLLANISELYLPIVKRRMHLEYTDQQRWFQLVRRGRYVEFNLIYDRGTLFGLKTGGRTESILMSLPPEVRWEVGFTPEQGTKEAELLEVLSNPREWLES